MCHLGWLSLKSIVLLLFGTFCKSSGNNFISNSALASNVVMLRCVYFWNLSTFTLILTRLRFCHSIVHSALPFKNCWRNLVMNTRTSRQWLQVKVHIIMFLILICGMVGDLMWVWALEGRLRGSNAYSVRSLVVGREIKDEVNFFHQSQCFEYFSVH